MSEKISLDSSVFDYITDKQYIVHKLDFLAQLWHIVGRKTNK